MMPAHPLPPQASKDPETVLAETERQWLYTEDELDRAPSCVAGMPPHEERLMRHKGVNFIIQVGVMLKLPQTTISTASVFLNRFMMRHSLISSKKEGYVALHHYVS
jgi:protein BUR2